MGGSTNNILDGDSELLRNEDYYGSDDEDRQDDVSMFSANDDLSPMVSERDEKKEVYKMSAKDTFRIQLGRVAVTVILLLTALGVTLTTFKLLKNEETHNFEVSVS